MGKEVEDVFESHARYIITPTIIRFELIGRISHRGNGILVGAYFIEKHCDGVGWMDGFCTYHANTAASATISAQDRQVYT
jgi:hypothetical protein